MNTTGKQAGATLRFAAVAIGVTLLASCTSSDATNEATPGTTSDGAITSPTVAATIPDESAAPKCDEAALQAAISDPDFVSFDEVMCADGWAGAGYINSDNFYNPVIFEAEGERWVLQDWATVCDLNPEMAPEVKVFCPGG